MQNLFFYATTVLIWGSTWFAITFQLGAAAESVSLYWRFGIAAVILIGYCYWRGLNMRFSMKEHRFIALQGLCLFSVNYLLFYWCTKYLTSGLVAVIFSTVIVMNIFNGAVFLKKSVEPLVLFGAVIGLTGIVLVFWSDVISIRAEVDSSRVLTGLLLGLIATLFASWGNVLSARNQMAGLPVIQTNAYGMLYGAVIMLVYSLVSGVSQEVDWSWSYSISLLFLAVPGSIFAFGAYLTLIGRIGADRAAYATVLFPIVALLISSVFEQFSFNAYSLVGIVLVLLGNTVVLGRRSLKPRAQTTAALED
ncbi:MAG: DMT family transporter [Gammaproteobacteria bacterium]|nr:DMT family transporter [Gammaproteobacteria bacterium]